ncbi:hypothetical protein SO802_009569 [Lithocarpus litseifolius]|uniref:RNase H type-1 domain-containing protein n=1 Tax=Lithocarpus litseifolius TaxID=425828 RepID=A0AAW2DCB4_9ROSI
MTLQASFQVELLDWLKSNCLCDPNIMVYGCPWRIQFPFAVWYLWKHRNRVVFKNTTLNMSLHTYCITQSIEYFYCVGEASKDKHYTVAQVRWKKPREGWAKLNTDGASLGNPGRAGGGGVIRDHRGMWMKGFARKIGHATSLLAKFLALRDGLQMALQLGINCLEVELDAKTVVQILLSNSNHIAAYSPLLNDCRYLLSKFQQVTINHAFREVNRCAD